MVLHLALEFVLSAALFMSRRGRGALLAAGIALHGGILLVHGLPSFGLTMMAALVLYLRPIERSFALPAARRALAFARRFIVAFDRSPSPQIAGHDR